MMLAFPLYFSNRLVVGSISIAWLSGPMKKSSYIYMFNVNHRY